MKITSNTMFSNPLRSASYHLFNKDYNELTNDEKQQVFDLASTSEDQFDKLLTSH